MKTLKTLFLLTTYCLLLTTSITAQEKTFQSFYGGVGFPDKAGTQRVIDHYNNYALTVPYPSYDTTIITEPVDTMPATVDTSIVTVYDTITVTVYDTISTGEFIDINFVGGKYRVFLEGNQVGSYHNKYSKAVQKMYRVRAKNPHAQVWIDQDKIEAR